MHSRTTYLLGIATAIIVALTWIIWALIAEPCAWKRFDALGVLISGLAFVGLIVTVAIQLGSMKESDKAAKTALHVQRQVSAVHALHSVREFAGARISHLAGQLAAGVVQETDNLSASQANAEISRLRGMIPRVEAELSRISDELLSSMAAESNAKGAVR